MLILAQEVALKFRKNTKVHWEYTHITRHVITSLKVVRRTSSVERTLHCGNGWVVIRVVVMMVEPRINLDDVLTNTWLVLRHVYKGEIEWRLNDM